MFGRNQKRIGAIILIFLILVNPEAQGAWLCVDTLTTFETEDFCENFCDGVCVEEKESGDWVCGEDTNEDGIVDTSELMKCTETQTCPLGDYPCDGNNQCSRPGSCAPGNSGIYICSLDGSSFSTESECQAACKETASCETSYACPNPELDCADMSIPESFSQTPPDLSSYEDDGPVDPDTGECLGQLFIFGGSPMMCRPSGWETHFHDCCDADAEMVDELGNQLTLLNNTLGTLKKIKEAVEVAQQAYKLYQDLEYMQNFVQLTEETATSLAEALHYSTEAGQAVAGMVEGGALTGSAGAAAAQALQSMLVSSVYGIVVAVILKFAMEWIFSGCDSDDLMTAAYDELGLCHYLDTICVKDSIFGCIQRASIFCCFNSKLARIIHEQGRPQLMNFGQDGGWGTAEEPNCRGFTPAEFQMLDFSKIDLSEWYENIKTTTQEEIRQKAEQNLENFRQNIQ